MSATCEFITIYGLCYTVPPMKGGTRNGWLTGSRTRWLRRMFQAPPRESSEESPSAGRQGSNPVFSSSFTPPCLLGDMPVSIHLTIIFLVKPLPTLVLWPRRHSKQQHLFQAPHMIGQARRHRWCARPPLLD
jgi:hypothetical protein